MADSALFTVQGKVLQTLQYGVKWKKKRHMEVRRSQVKESLATKEGILLEN